MTFDSLGLSGPILTALAQAGHDTPTPIQARAIPLVLEGRDLIGLAQTGTGKTAAFALPILHRLAARRVAQGPARPLRALILSPTRELAAQIATAFQAYGQGLKLASACVVGGEPVRRQIARLKQGVDILVATPGRLEDLIAQGAVRLNQVETVVLDEADQMLDIGFFPAIKRILGQTPRTRQTLLFSATMPGAIRELSQSHLTDPAEVAVTPVARTADRIAQSVLHMQPGDKAGAVADLVRDNPGRRVIVFTRTKRGADKVARKLNGAGLAAAAIHGNKSQGQRQRALAAFRDGSAPVLIATDIAARGIDVPGVELVVNHDLPNVPESYVHRIGRTARAGASGRAVSFCAGDEVKLLRDIERLIRQPIPAEAVAGTEIPQGPPAGGPKRAGATPSGKNRRRRNRRRGAHAIAAE